jgi:hypothetical protein
MNAPRFTTRNPEAIVAENVYFDSAGYTYRGLSWLDYAKRKSAACAVFYSALEMRQAIEQLLFEEIVLSVGGQLDRADYGKAKGSSTKLSKILRRLSPEYNRRVSFTRAVIDLELGAPPLISWDHVKLLNLWGRISVYLHWGGEPRRVTYSSLLKFEGGVSLQGSDQATLAKEEHPHDESCEATPIGAECTGGRPGCPGRGVA